MVQAHNDFIAVVAGLETARSQLHLAQIVEKRQHDHPTWKRARRDEIRGRRSQQDDEDKRDGVRLQRHTERVAHNVARELVEKASDRDAGEDRDNGEQKEDEDHSRRRPEHGTERASPHGTPHEVAVSGPRSGCERSEMPGARERPRCRACRPWQRNDVNARP